MKRFKLISGTPVASIRQSVVWSQILTFDSSYQRVAVERALPWWRQWLIVSLSIRVRLRTYCRNSGWQQNSCWRWVQRDGVCVQLCWLSVRWSLDLCSADEAPDEEWDAKWPFKEHSGHCYCQNATNLCSKHTWWHRWLTHTHTHARHEESTIPTTCCVVQRMVTSWPWI